MRKLVRFEVWGPHQHGLFYSYLLPEPKGRTSGVAVKACVFLLELHGFEEFCNKNLSYGNNLWRMCLGNVVR